MSEAVELFRSSLTEARAAFPAEIQAAIDEAKKGRRNPNNYSNTRASHKVTTALEKLLAKAMGATKFAHPEQVASGPPARSTATRTKKAAWGTIKQRREPGEPAPYTIRLKAGGDLALSSYGSHGLNWLTWWPPHGKMEGEMSLYDRVLLEYAGAGARVAGARRSVRVPVGPTVTARDMTPELIEKRKREQAQRFEVRDRLRILSIEDRRPLKTLEP